MKKLIFAAILGLVLSTSAQAEMIKVAENDFSEFFVDTNSVKFIEEAGDRRVVFNGIIKMAPGVAAKQFGKKYAKVGIIENRYALGCVSQNFLSVWTKMYDAKGKYLMKQGESRVEQATPGTFIGDAYNYLCTDDGGNAKADEAK